MLPRLDHEGRGDMPKAVEGQGRIEPSSFHGRTEHSGGEGSPKWPALRTNEDEIVRSSSSTMRRQVNGQLFHDESRQGQGADGRFGFRLLGAQTPLDLRNRLVDSQRLANEIDAANT